MPENIGYQFNRLYPAPIETNRQVNTISDRNAIPMSIRWEGMFVYVISESTTFELVGGTDNTKWQVKEGLSDAPQDGEIYGRKDGQWEIISGSTEPYKVYTALITQIGTSAPTANVLENTLGGTVVWSRIGEGEYLATLSGAFTGVKTICFTTIYAGLSYPATAQAGKSTDNAVVLQTREGASLADNFSNLNFEIRVYP